MRHKRKPRAKCVIYGLCDPGTENIRYVGQTTQTIKKRMGWHYRAIKKSLRTGKRLSPAQSWMHHLGPAAPNIVILDSAATWDVSEVIWIERCRVAGHNLLNVLRGGNDSYDAVVRDTGYRAAPTYSPIDPLEREYRDILA